MEPVAIIAILASVPIVAILSRTFLKGLTIITGRNVLTNKDYQKLLASKSNENEELKQRIENLESVISGLDHELLDGMLRLHALDNKNDNKKRIESHAKAASGSYIQEDGIEKNVKSIANKVLKKIDQLLDENQSTGNTNNPYRR